MMKVLILSASTGGGHKQASNALRNYIIDKDIFADVKIVDALEYCGELFNKTITDGYYYLATKMPNLYGTVYKISDKETALNSVIGIVNDFMSKKLLPLFEEYEPDIVVSCHPFATEMVAKLKELGLISTPLIAIITDYAPHRAYIRDFVDAYVTSNDEMTSALVNEYDVSADKIHSLGIPINNAFYEEKDELKIIEKIGFDPNIPILLIMAGSFGVNDILKIYKNLLEIENEFQIIIITGKNRKLYDEFEKLIEKSYDNGEEESSKIKIKFDKIKDQIADKIDDKHIKDILQPKKVYFKPTRLFYFINNVVDYMSIADLIITKPGGLTVSESLACNLPMLIFEAFPGQEEDNADYLVRNNVGIKLEKGIKGANQVKYLLENPEKLQEMRENCRRTVKNRSAEHIYNLILELLKQ